MTAPFSVVRRNFVGTLGNHAQTTQWSYTVPTDKRATVTFGFVNLEESTAIAANSAALAFLVNGAVIVELDSMNQVGQRDMFFEGIDLVAGDVLSFVTRNSTATNAIFMGTCSIREYQ